MPLPMSRHDEEMARVHAWLSGSIDPARTARRLVSAVQRARSMALDATGSEYDAARHEPWLFSDSAEILLTAMAAHDEPTRLDIMNYLTLLDGADSVTLKAALIGQGLSALALTPGPLTTPATASPL